MEREVSQGENCRLFMREGSAINVKVAHAPLKVGDDETGNGALYLDCHDVGRAPPPCIHARVAWPQPRSNSCHTNTSPTVLYAVVSVKYACHLHDQA